MSALGIKITHVKTPVSKIPQPHQTWTIAFGTPSRQYDFEDEFNFRACVDKAKTLSSDEEKVIYVANYINDNFYDVGNNDCMFYAAVVSYILLQADVVSYDYSTSLHLATIVKIDGKYWRVDGQRFANGDRTEYYTDIEDLQRGSDAGIH